jgi:hypothetical protein
MTSVCRGSGRGIDPCLSKSKRENEAAISSIAQHAVPMGIIHSE